VTVAAADIDVPAVGGLVVKSCRDGEAMALKRKGWNGQGGAAAIAAAAIVAQGCGKTTTMTTMMMAMTTMMMAMTTMTTRTMTTTTTTTTTAAMEAAAGVVALEGCCGDGRRLQPECQAHYQTAWSCGK
jgi:hypothetical protein